MKTGMIASHGTLPVYRKPEEAVRVAIDVPGLKLKVYDNYLEIGVEAADIQSAVRRAEDVVDLCCQSLSAQTGIRFSATLRFIEDEQGNPKQLVQRKAISLGQFASYNLGQLQEQIATAFAWAQSADARARKALLYYEHALLLREHALTLELFSPHSAFSRALSFLQLWKALTVILGEPGTDQDYQRRFKELGLPKTFWKDRVEPLYLVRNDEDVAHYRVDPPDPSRFADHFGKASMVFRDALVAHMAHAGIPARDA